MTAGCRTFHVRAEVVADLTQDEVDVVLPWNRVGRHFGGRVGRPGDGHLLPGQEEDDAAVARRRVEQTHVVGAEGKKQDVVLRVFLYLMCSRDILEKVRKRGAN